MPYLDFNTSNFLSVAPGVVLRPLWGEKIMLVRVELDAGSEVPMHSHPHEQAGIVLEGEFDLIIGEETKRLKKGDPYLIPGDIRHGVITGNEPAVALDIFNPPREDYMK